MQELVMSIQQSLRTQNWYAALSTALTLPDICGSMESLPRGRKRYMNWFEKYLASHYISSGIAFLSASDFYALRCAFLHAGTDDISEEKIRETVNRFLFISPPSDGTSIHMKKLANDGLLLQVNILCEQISNAAEEWMREKWQIPEVQARLANRMIIGDIIE